MASAKAPRRNKLGICGELKEATVAGLWWARAASSEREAGPVDRGGESAGRLLPSNRPEVREARTQQPRRCVRGEEAVDVSAFVLRACR